VQGTTALGSLQVKIEREAYVEEEVIYHGFALGDDLLARLEARPEVLAATARVNLFGLIGNEQRSQVARILGVDPAREAAATPIKQAIIRGEWLAVREVQARGGGDGEPVRGVVLGEVLARQLKVDIGDELVSFLEAADGSLGNELFIVTGIARTGNTALDRQAAYVHLEDAQFLGALEGQVHEIALRTTDASRADAVAAALRTMLAGQELEHAMSVRSWREVQPAMSQLLDMSANSNWVLYFIIYLVASLGIMNTQRMSALERRREFAMLLAMGVTPRKLFQIVVAETVVLALVGALVGSALGTALSLYHASAGIDLSMFSDQTSFSYLGVSFSDRIYTSLDPYTAIEPVWVMLIVAFVCGTWPALQSARINITQALSGRV
ncbi:MAG: ABC transporter permease, partial [Bradymonadaceae bacterium]|nr:ABC transporter permease [Lujinxingiaceae bacterium]